MWIFHVSAGVAFDLISSSHPAYFSESLLFLREAIGILFEAVRDFIGAVLLSEEVRSGAIHADIGDVPAWREEYLSTAEKLTWYDPTVGSRRSYRLGIRFSLLSLFSLCLRAERGGAGWVCFLGLRMWCNLLAMYLPILEKLWLSIRMSDIILLLYLSSLFA